MWFLILIIVKNFILDITRFVAPNVCCMCENYLKINIILNRSGKFISRFDHFYSSEKNWLKPMCQYLVRENFLKYITAKIVFILWVMWRCRRWWRPVSCGWSLWMIICQSTYIYLRAVILGNCLKVNSFTWLWVLSEWRTIIIIKKSFDELMALSHDIEQV